MGKTKDFLKNNDFPPGAVFYNDLGIGTAEQRSQLRKLKFGSEQRRGYLYNLASSPTVLAAQRAAPQP